MYTKLYVIYSFIQVSFQPKSVDSGHSHIEGAAKTLQKPGIPGVDPAMITVQCFPFYSVLLAVGRTQIDFFSLDVEGHELKILKTIPWHKVDIKVRFAIKYIKAKYAIYHLIIQIHLIQSH